MELKHCSISFDRQVIMPVRYRGEIIGEKRFDLIVGGRLIVELKAVSELLELHRAQLITYLKIAQLKLGLLINFNSYPLKDGIKRVICP